ncbi:unnamed protein product [Mesocestoides corti]|uniref:Succinate dehydrogenase assembly factor 3 n=1 Tax=Mesocestoides corti TaxID=53468 RepID=A0A0R3UMI1_MESCO|nr:unnamed protein product [Mesocestoides corti]
MKSVLNQMSHRERVRFLYKMILRTHRALPPELRAVGDRYVKEEFRKHKSCDPSYVGPFMIEWTQYVMDINDQIRAAIKAESDENSNTTVNYGACLKKEDFEYFSEAQLAQLLALADELHGVSHEDQSQAQPSSPQSTPKS